MELAGLHSCYNGVNGYIYARGLRRVDALNVWPYVRLIYGTPLTRNQIHDFLQKRLEFNLI